MPVLYTIPNWFFGFDIAMELAFGIITLAIALKAYQVYALSKERTLQRFGSGFLFIAISYLVWAALNFFIVSQTSSGFRTLSLDHLARIGILGVYAHILFFIVGLVMLVYTTFKFEQGEIHYLLLGLSLLVVAASFDKLITFRILSVFLLSFITYHYGTEWYQHKNKKTRSVLYAFILLLLSNADFIFSSYSYKPYVIGHFLELGAYALLLFTLLRSAK